MEETLFLKLLLQVLIDNGSTSVLEIEKDNQMSLSLPFFKLFILFSLPKSFSLISFVEIGRFFLFACRDEGIKESRYRF